MTPRVDVVGLPIPVHAADVAQAVREIGPQLLPRLRRRPRPPRRRPLRERPLPHRVGARRPQRRRATAAPRRSRRPLDISRRLRQPYLVPESRLVLDVLADMRRDRRAFAVVVDEYGGVAGRPHREGPARGARGRPARRVRPRRRARHHPRRPHPLAGRRRRQHRRRPRAAGHRRSPRASTSPSAGYLFDAFGHIPEEGERITFDGWELRVAEMDKRRVAKVVVQAVDAAPPTETTPILSRRRRPRPGLDRADQAREASRRIRQYHRDLFIGGPGPRRAAGPPAQRAVAQLG